MLQEFEIPDSVTEIFLLGDGDSDRFGIDVRLRAQRRESSRLSGFKNVVDRQVDELAEITTTSSRKTHFRACGDVASRAPKMPPAILPAPITAPIVQSMFPL